MNGLAIPLAIYALVLVLHVALPARRVTGYARDGDGNAITYRLNGLLVFIATLGLAWLSCSWLGVPYDALYQHRWASLGGACAIGLVFSVVVVWREPSTGKSFLADLFLGRAENPQWLGGRVDAKMFLYLVGAVMLELNLLSFAAHQVMSFATPSPGVLLYTALFTWFILDYLFFEHVHLYTYDLFAERVGFKLGWGCLTFYPFFYLVGAWALAGEPNPSPSAGWLALGAATFFGGWALARGANMQKFTFKRDPSRTFLGIAPELVKDGQNQLLCSGFWGVSRHVNYLGEILMATGLALSLGQPTSPWPWLYPLYYVLLLVPRERDDHRRCAAKYGTLWTTYCERVPRRIIPGLY
jgi:delta14-sterol reductase